MSGRLVTVQTLLKRGAGIDDEAISGQTALHKAALHGHTLVIQELLQHFGKDNVRRQDVVLAQDEEGNTAFTLAVSQDHLDITKALLESFSSSNSKATKLQGKSKNALNIAARNNHEKVAQLLLDHGWDISDKDEGGLTALHHAAAAGGVELIKLLLEKGADPNTASNRGERPLHGAAAPTPGAVMALLDNEGTDINISDDENVTPLWRASWNGKLECVKALLMRSPYLDLRDDSYGYTALHAAYDNPDITKLLLDAGANPTLPTATGEPPLVFVADQTNGLKTVEYYLDAEVDPNIRNTKGLTALHVAAEAGQLETLKLLEARGTDINATGIKGETALHLAAYEGHLNVVEYLLQSGVNINQLSESLGTPLIAAADGGGAWVEVVTTLLGKGAEPNLTSMNFKHHTALQAVAGRSSDAMRALLDAGADVNVVGGHYGSPLCTAVAAGNKDNALLLLEAGAMVDYCGGPKGTALEYALSRGFWDVADLCLEWDAGVNILSRGKHGTALIAAIHGESVDKVKQLLQRGADPNLCASSGESPIQAAIRKGRDDIFEAILEGGGQISSRDQHGMGPVSNVIIHKSLGLLSYLWGIEGIDTNETDAVGRTPLMLAVLQGIDVVQQLLSNGANLDLQDQWGKTALMYAITRDYPTLVSELIVCGADLFKKDARGRDALYWACWLSSHDTFSQVLQEMKTLDPLESSFQRAINAAVASGKPEVVKRLLENMRNIRTQTDDDGWMISHAVLRYDNDDIGKTVKEAVIEAGERMAEPLSPTKLPREWHEIDLSAALFRGEDARTIMVSKTYRPLKSDTLKGIARADHPMWPQQDGVYYFEVSIENGGNNNKGRFAVGFCNENESLENGLGETYGSWGYFGDDGKAVCTDSTTQYGPLFGEGDVIGCGVNFEQNFAFYTKNGEIIGQAFANVFGKLYPAISVDVRLTECAFSARFWEGGEFGNEDFKFKGPFNDQSTFQKSARPVTEANTTNSPESDADSTSSESFMSDDE
ncbi:Ankyrin-1 [Colletotrichum fructicola]|nr:Ankyrin-1 [Colletotrichum fructicola]KAF4928481.1 Ankyrin-1 [Colletotrichum fructicola]KAF5487893.1 Ankyrin-1 [Colletotrichum fructicola]